LVLLCLPVIALAAGDGRAEREKTKLESLRGQRAALERQLKQSESSHAETADRLRDTEKSISSVGRKLRVLAEERAVTKAELAERERELKQLERQTAARQAQLARLLRYQFRPHEADALAVLLSGGDPNAAARDRHFLALLSRAKAELIAGLRRDAVETRHLAEVVQQRNDKLTEIAQREEDERATLRQRQQERQVVLANIANQIKAQRREIDTLKQNEQRLGQLIDSLAKRPPPPVKAKPPAQAGRGRSSDPPPPVLAAEPVRPGGSFAKLRGKLIHPVRGTVTGRFGTRRDNGESVWKGMFIRAAEGTDVRAAAGGIVVFADWLRGYGNLVIIDHDDDFLSVYGNNQTLLVDVGQKVGAGATVATVGTGIGGGGGQADSGLYFELRHQGRAFDPAKWLIP
jgi:septal ring factor EnvC (AmiA/AmiB activator)